MYIYISKLDCAEGSFKTHRGVHSAPTSFFAAGASLEVDRGHITTAGGEANRRAKLEGGASKLTKF